MTHLRRATDIKHAHTVDNPSVGEELPHDRIDEARLRTETFELAIGVWPSANVNRRSATV
jgi:hypothetical protein